MNQPTREEFEQLKAGQKRLEEEFRQFKEQRTEEIKVTRIEVASEDVLNRLKTLEEGQQRISQKQDKVSADVDELKIDAKAYTGDAAIFKNKVERIESDVSTIKTDVGTLKTDVEQVKTVQSGHSKFFEEHGKRLAATATKDDLGQLRNDMKSEILAMKNEILDAMKQLLQQKPGE